MLQLRARLHDFQIQNVQKQVLLVTRNLNTPSPIRENYALLADKNTPGEACSDFNLVLAFSSNAPELRNIENYLILPPQLEYVTEGDIVSFDDAGNFRVIFRKLSRVREHRSL